MDIIKDSQCTKYSPARLDIPAEPVYGKGISIEPQYPGRLVSDYDRKIHLPRLLPLEEYDQIIVLFSGGKDGIAAFFRLLELGVPKSKIALWHHDIDGGHPNRRMDWPVTRNYVKSFAEAMDVSLRFSWRVNGFFGELYRVGASYPIQYEDNGEIKTCRLSSSQVKSEQLRERILQRAGSSDSELLKSLGYRMRFPAKSGDLARRWCSAYLKIAVADSLIWNLKDMGSVEQFPAKSSIAIGRYCSPQLKREVADTVIRDLTDLAGISRREKLPAKSGCRQGRWCSGTLKAEVQNGVTTNLDSTCENVKLLIISGERRGESSNRAKLNEMEIHRVNATARARRLVHQWRPVIDYSLRDVWEVLRQYHINPHPCYSCGWNRCSCAACIFSLPSHWAGIRELLPDVYEALRQDELRLGFTIDNKKPLDEFVGNAKSCVYRGDPKALYQLVSGEFTTNDVIASKWDFPAGAFRGSEGGPC